MLKEKTFEAGSVTINYVEGAPNGAPIVLLHGISDRWQGLRRLMMGLEDKWRVFACDMRGHGKSGRTDAYRAVDYFSDITAFVERRVGAPAVLLGHSNGAMTALGVAAEIPEFVQAMVILDPPLHLREVSRSPGRTGDFLVKIHEIVTGKKTLREGVSEIFPGIGEPGIRWFDETLAGLDPEVVRVMMEGSYTDGLDLKALLGKVACPILMLYGEEEKGGLVRPSDVEFFLAHARKGEAVQIKDAPLPSRRAARPDPGLGNSLAGSSPKVRPAILLLTKWIVRLILIR